MADFDIAKWNKKRYLSELKETEFQNVRIEDLELGVTLSKGAFLPQPNSDISIRIIDESDLNRWKEGKDPNIIVQIPYDKYGRIEIPEFEEGRQKYRDMKFDVLKGWNK